MGGTGTEGSKMSKRGVECQWSIRTITRNNNNTQKKKGRRLTHCTVLWEDGRLLKVEDEE